MTARDGNGWTRCGLGHRHWGRHGAAGLLVAARDPERGLTVLLAQRSLWGSHGGTWGPPGGAMDSHESPAHAALREAAEECGIRPAAVTVHGVLEDDHGGWVYHTVLGSAQAPLPAGAISDEARDVAWVPVDDVAGLRLHPGFAGQWPVLRAGLEPLTVIVDAANVMGARADGWWKDRAAAASRLCGELAALAETGVADLPDSAGLPSLQRRYPSFVVVLEGAARAAATGEPAADGQAPPGHGRLRVVRAARSGDDEIAALAASLPGHRLVVTADRELRARCQGSGASVTGPRWLLGLLRPGR